MRNLVLSCLLIITLSGCASVPYRTSSKFNDYFDSSKEVVVVSPDVKMYSLTAGGVDEFSSEWSKESKMVILKRIEKEFVTFRGLKFSSIQESTLSEGDFQLLDEQKGMFFTLADNIMMHTYLPATTFKHKVRNFDYTLGNEISSLNKLISGDTYLFCSAKNYIWTAGRTTLATFGFLTALVTGVAIIVPAGNEFIAVALVDSVSGDIIWFNYLPMPGDMRDEKVVDGIVTRLFKDFPKKWRIN